MMYYLSNTIIHFTTNQQFPINSFQRFPLTILIFPAEIFSFLFTLYFIYNLLNGSIEESSPKKLSSKDKISVAILLPVYNEPMNVVQRTIIAAKKVEWPGQVNIYILDDSNNVADKKNMALLSKRFDCMLITRKDNVGYKAGNVNNAIKHYIKEEFFIILDADQAPEPELLDQTMDNFSDDTIGFVQTPQHYINADTPLERAATLGTNIFFQAQCQSKSRDHATPFCGTNAVIRTSAFKAISGFSYYTSTEDLELGIRMDSQGYHGVYVAKNLVHGYAPVDYKAYSSQQYRWANGNVAILRENWKNILFGNLTLRQQIHAIFTLGWWIIGVVTLIYIIVPLLSFFIGGTHHTWLPTWILILLFFNVLIGIGIIYVSLHGRTDEKIYVSDALLQYSLITNSAFIYAYAVIKAAFKNYTGFVRTNKVRSDSGISLIKWNIMLAIICFGFSIFSLFKAAGATDINTLRTFLPISLWLLFYTLILGSSIIFIGEQAIPESIAERTTFRFNNINTEEAAA